MKASELIAALQMELEFYGDLPVFSVDDSAEYEVTEVKAQNPSQGINVHSEIVQFPERLLIG